MEKALLADTDKVVFTDAERKVVSSNWGKNTAQAVLNGINFTQLAIIEKCIARCKQQFAMIQFIVTGGNARDLLAELPEGVSYNPDLVLDGLQIYIESKDY